MQKIKSLFQRDYEGTREIFDAIVEGSEWVTNGEGVATLKFDGTSCMIRNGKLYKRFDRKRGKAAPEGWEAAQEPDEKTGHWPGWLPVGDAPEDKWHREGLANWENSDGVAIDGTFELVGPKVQSNPYNLEVHKLWRHGATVIDAPRTFDELKAWLADNVIEGVVWHHPDGRMVKIKRKDFGYKWPEVKKV